MRIIRIIGIISVIILMGWGIITIDEIGEHPEKLWLHRCNSMEKLIEHQDKYTNFEVDVVFREDSVFDVTHDLDTTFNLSLKSYFLYMQQQDGKLWLDIKNLNLYNGKVMLDKLNELVSLYQIDKNKLIIESRCWRALDWFTQAGYYTSLYVAYERPSQLERDEVKTYIHRLRKIVDQKVVHALSFPGWWYDVIKDHLHRSIDLLTWEHRKTQFQLLLSPKGQEMLEDPQLKVILVKDKGQFHR